MALFKVLIYLAPKALASLLGFMCALWQLRKQVHSTRKLINHWLSITYRSSLLSSEEKKLSCVENLNKLVLRAIKAKFI